MPSKSPVVVPPKAVIEKVAREKDREYGRRRFGLVQDVVSHVSGKRMLAYGGFALNLLLPEADKIYPASQYVVMDIDMYTLDEKKAAEELANFLVRKGYRGVTRSRGLNDGTAKVFAEGLGVADFSRIPAEAFEKLWALRIEVDRVGCVPSEYLFHTMFRILSQPFDAAFRWEKTYTRMLTFHRYYGTKGRFLFEDPRNPAHHQAFIDAVRAISGADGEFPGGVALGGAVALRLASRGDLSPTGGWLSAYTRRRPAAVARAIAAAMRAGGVGKVDVLPVGSVHGLAPHAEIETTLVGADGRDTGIRARIYEVDDCRSVVAHSSGVLVATAMTELMHVTNEFLFDADSGRILRADVDAASNMIIRASPESFLQSMCIGDYEGMHTKRLRQVVGVGARK